MDYSSSDEDLSIDDLSDLEGEQASNIRIPPSYSTSSQIDAKSLYQEPFPGMEFASDSAARAFYNAYAQKLGFGIRVARSRTERRKGLEVLVMKRFVCLKEGHHKKKAPAAASDSAAKKKRKRLSMRDGCPALMEVVRRGPDKWVVNKLVLDHTHVVVSPDRARELQQQRLSSKYIQKQNLLNEMRRKVFGKDGDARILLDYFKKMQLKNKGFFYAIQVDSTNSVTNAVWIDAKHRVWYTYFGDAVTFDTTCIQNDNIPPLACFSGANQHGELVVFGYALVLDKTELGFRWISDTWLTGMGKRHPISITTDQHRSLSDAVVAAFPQTYHRFCRWRIFSRCKNKLSDLYFRFPTLHEEIKRCVNEPDNVEIFEVCWKSLVDKYDLSENDWLGFLYGIRNKWVPAYLTTSFFAELSTFKRPESIKQVCRGHFSTSKVSLMNFIIKFDELMESRCEKEAQSESTVMHHPEPVLKTDMIMEKQAASVYTKESFEIFQSELVESLHHYTVKSQDGPYCKYSVERVGDTTHTRYQHTVFFSPPEKKAWCNCNKFSLSGILCRHVLAVFFLTGVILLPEHYITKRWTRLARMGPEIELQDPEQESCCENSVIMRYDDLVRDAMRCVEKGASSPVCYKIAKEVIRNALREISRYEENFGRFRPGESGKV
ncbi:FAR1-domain family sequence [Rhynchospora pubera]|uniref:Protein FAR1-RELATED SEQUENCE n=1 Tax=Rhynchospora pubera TaxID=906938 RepID=A0AAV8HH15_9POAL|nr:FAR1-domain family sequence [Rhynchospora pubera]